MILVSEQNFSLTRTQKRFVLKTVENSDLFLGCVPKDWNFCEAVVGVQIGGYELLLDPHAPLMYPNLPYRVGVFYVAVKGTPECVDKNKKIQTKKIRKAKDDEDDVDVDMGWSSNLEHIVMLS
jgi:hypothetical protein